MSRPESIRRVLLVLTSQCNLRCGYCYQNDKKPGRMDQDTMFRGIDLAFVSKHDTVEITFFGGEPLLEMDSLRSGVAYAEERGRASGKK
jgi:uncharacterized protein